MRTVEVVIPGRPPTANARLGIWRLARERAEWKGIAHDAAVRVMVQGPYARAYLLTAISGRSSVPGDDGTISSLPDRSEWWPLERAEIAVEWRCRYRRKRDFDNLIGGLKPLLDGLVASGIIRDDSSDVLVSLGPLTIVTGSKDDAVVLRIREVQG